MARHFCKDLQNSDEKFVMFLRVSVESEVGGGGGGERPRELFRPPESLLPPLKDMRWP